MKSPEVEGCESPNEIEGQEKLWEALRRVYDPELGLDIVSLGLVYDVRNEDGHTIVEMTLTTPGCPASDSLPAQVEIEIAKALGDDAPEPRVLVVWDPPWTPARLSEDVGALLGFRR